MDYSKLTLGELLSSENETIRRNAVAVLKLLQGSQHGIHQSFLKEIEAYCEAGLNSENPQHWQASLSDILGIIRGKSLES